MQKTTNRRVSRWFNDLAEFQPQFNAVSILTMSVTATHSAKQLYSTGFRVQEILHSISSGKEVPHYSVNNGKLYYQPCDDVNLLLVIPGNKDLKNRVSCENHGMVAAGHPGYIKTCFGIQKNYYWLKISKYIQLYVNTCKLCQCNKARQTKDPRLLKSLEIPEGKCVDISMDFMAALPRTIAGKGVIKIIVKGLTNRVLQPIRQQQPTILLRCSWSTM
ncbi:Retrotransposon protein, Ty3-gypsy subclass [Phytophthora megakarya]|uniref:Retrotransposon protein, Ty3-gypsy subclass n=1 Tax=Phytophthora megakarya TaxID=4795 RepID=A0A225WAJ7_9STRA|nr:Retrotransposon protein, Ty3-gypsy subclass [Phytophthora megakarya]